MLTRLRRTTTNKVISVRLRCPCAAPGSTACHDLPGVRLGVACRAGRWRPLDGHGGLPCPPSLSPVLRTPNINFPGRSVGTRHRVVSGASGPAGSTCTRRSQAGRRSPAVSRYAVRHSRRSAPEPPRGGPLAPTDPFTDASGSTPDRRLCAYRGTRKPEARRRIRRGTPTWARCATPPTWVRSPADHRNAHVGTAGMSPLARFTARIQFAARNAGAEITLGKRKRNHRAALRSPTQATLDGLPGPCVPRAPCPKISDPARFPVENHR